MGAIRPGMSMQGPYGAQPMNRPMMRDPSSLVSQLGIQTRLTMGDQPLFNEALVQNIANYREQAIPALKNLFMGSDNITTVLEGLYTATKMADAQVAGLEQLYPVLLRWNSHPDPMIQMHLARFYRKINEPKSFGPMLATAVNYAVNQYSMSSSPAYNVTQEVGETLLNQIAVRTAQETVWQLMPYLQALQAPATPDRKK